MSLKIVPKFEQLVDDINRRGLYIRLNRKSFMALIDLNFALRANRQVNHVGDEARPGRKKQKF